MISFVYFDVGGVAIHDFSASNKWFNLQDEIGVSKDQRDHFNEIWNRYEPRICVDYDIDKFVPILREELNLNLPDDFSLLSEFVNRFERNKGIQTVINQASKVAPIGLLTNMYPRMFAAIKDKDILPQANFKEIIDSSLVQLQKPDQAIYTLAQEKAGVPPEEILFIENTQMHINAAEKQGWQTFLYDSGNTEKSDKELLELFHAAAKS